MEYFTTGSFVLINVVGAICCLTLGRRAPGQTWRFLAAASFAISVLSSLMYLGLNLYTRNADSYSNVATLYAAAGVLNVLMAIAATALVLAALLMGRSAGAATQPGHGGQWAQPNAGGQPGYGGQYSAQPGPYGQPAPGAQPYPPYGPPSTPQQYGQQPNPQQSPPWPPANH